MWTIRPVKRNKNMVQMAEWACEAGEENIRKICPCMSASLVLITQILPWYWNLIFSSILKSICIHLNYIYWEKRCSGKGNRWNVCTMYKRKLSNHPRSSSGKSWQSSASIDVQWVATIVCQCWQDSARICQKMTNYRKGWLLAIIAKYCRPVSQSPFCTKHCWGVNEQNSIVN